MTWGAHMGSVILAAAGAIPIDGGNVRAWLVGVAGNIFIAVVVIRGALAAIRARFLELVTMAALAAVCAVFVYFPDTFQALGTSLHNVLASGG